MGSIMIREIDIKNQTEWDSIVRSFPNYDVFYLSQYSKVFMRESPKNGEPVLLLYEDGIDRAINVFFRRDVAMDKHLTGKIERGSYYDLITPYGYGGFFGNISDWDKLNREYTAYCIENHYISAERLSLGRIMWCVHWICRLMKCGWISDRRSGRM